MYENTIMVKLRKEGIEVAQQVLFKIDFEGEII